MREGGPISYEARPFEFELRGDRPLAVGLHLYGEGLFVTTNQSLITKAPPRTGFRSRRVGLAYQVSDWLTRVALAAVSDSPRR